LGKYLKEGHREFGIPGNVFYKKALRKIRDIDAFMTKLHPACVPNLNCSSNFVIFVHALIFGKSPTGRIGEFGGPDPARGLYFGDP